VYINQDSLHDTNMRYRGCLVLIKDKVIKITDILHITKTTIKFLGREWRNFGYLHNQEYELPIKEINHSKVPPQYVNFMPSKGCGMIRRIAKRGVYSLGTKHDNTTVVQVPQIPSRLELLPYALTRVGKDYPSREKAYRQIQANVSPARALSKRVALVKQGEDVLTYLLNKPIGKLTDETNVEVSYKHKYFKEELEELGFKVNLIEIE